MDNQIHFEQTPYHHVYLKDRKTLELTGIKKIESFDSLEFLIETSLGYLNIKGSDLALVRFDQEKKEVSIKGLLKINEGILRAYFLVSILAGYVVYQNLMHEKMYIVIVKINQKLTRLFKPVRFVFLKFDGIIGSIKKRVKR